MLNKSFGFVGGGRVTRFMLSGFKKQGQWPKAVSVSDSNAEILNRLKGQGLYRKLKG